MTEKGESGMKLLRKRPWRIFMLTFLVWTGLGIVANVYGMLNGTYGALTGVDMLFYAIITAVMGVGWAYVASRYPYWWNR
jgi:hypothetical protein